jgi:hypothetical protein
MVIWDNGASALGSTTFDVFPQGPQFFEIPSRAERGGRLPFPIEAVPDASALQTRMVRIAGWPYACAWGAVDEGLRLSMSVNSEVSSKDYGAAPISALYVGRPLDQSDPHGIAGYLPIAPIWSGLVIDTLFYGTIAWGLLFLPGTLRRWRRRRGGRCVKCGYDLKGLPAGAACPECGAST